jgi:hypothetical protein
MLTVVLLLIVAMPDRKNVCYEEECVGDFEELTLYYRRKGALVRQFAGKRECLATSST